GATLRPEEAEDPVGTVAGDLDPGAGRLVAALVRPGRLLVVAHHLVVDAVSWQVIAEDLEAVHAGRTPAPEQTSLRRWAQLLDAAVADGSFDADARASRPVLPGTDTPLADGGAAAGPLDATVADERQTVHEASAATTSALLEDVPRAFRTGADAVLVTALAVALARWRAASTPDPDAEPQTWSLIEREGHGRETRFVPGPGGREADLSRTVGWFTSLYPVVVDPGAVVGARGAEGAGTDAPEDAGVDAPEGRGVDARAIARAVSQVKDALAAVPGHGVPYQAVSALDPAAPRPPQPQVLFNFLGRVEAGTGDAAADTTGGADASGAGAGGAAADTAGGAAGDAAGGTTGGAAGDTAGGARMFRAVGPTGQLGERRDPGQALPRELEFNAVAEPAPAPATGSATATAAGGTGGTGEPGEAGASGGYVLRTTVSWVDGRIADDRIDLLLRLWDEALREVAAVADHATLSPGDVHPAPVTQADLEDLASPGLVDVLPLTPLQHGMYFHSVFDDSPSTYVEQQIIHLGPDAAPGSAPGSASDSASDSAPAGDT
ncbi:condensation domain-containing protein, partial [Corynebacterium bovis]